MLHNMNLVMHLIDKTIVCTIGYIMLQYTEYIIYHYVIDIFKTYNTQYTTIVYSYTRIYTLPLYTILYNTILHYVLYVLWIQWCINYFDYSILCTISCTR